MTAPAAERLAVVTGANRGIGLAIARLLAERGFHTVATARGPRGGAEALRPLLAAGLDVELRKLDVTRAEEARALAKWLSDNHASVDVLVNNAGIMTESRHAEPARSADPMTVSPATVMEHFNVNALGAVRMIQALAPLMHEDARIVNVSSGMGQLSEMGGGYLGYRLSKAALNAATRVFARELASRRIGVYAVCPGWVRTRIGGENAPRSPEEGADTILWLATVDPAPESGRFYRNRAALDW